MIEPIRRPRDRLIGQPQERQHSAAAGGRGTDCPRRGVPYQEREGIVTEWPRRQSRGGISTAARGAQRLEPGPKGALNQSAWWANTSSIA